MKTCFIKQDLKRNHVIVDEIRRKRTIFHLFTIISLTLTVALAFLVSFVIFSIHKDVQYNLPLVSQKVLKEFSVLYEDLSLSPDDDDGLVFAANRDSLCVPFDDDGKCVCRINNLTELINQVVERETRLRLAKGLGLQLYLSCGNESIAPKSGHLTIALTQISRQKFFSGNGKDAVLHWKNISDTVVQHSNGEIIVTEGRTYFVYASVHFNISQRVKNETRNMNRLCTFSLRICRKTQYGHEQTLLGETKQYNVSDGDAVSSLRIASHLHLNRNDTIYVKVKNVNYVILSSKGNTFGYFPL